MAEEVRPGKCVVAVDGPSGSGKSTVSRRLATALDGVYLDTGAMYRAVTWAVLQAGVDLTDQESIAKIAVETDLSIGTDPTAPHFEANGVSVDEPIRGAEVTLAVSAVAAVPAVRKHLVSLQQDIIAAHPRIVVEVEHVVPERRDRMPGAEHQLLADLARHALAGALMDGRAVAPDEGEEDDGARRRDRPQDEAREQANEPARHAPVEPSVHVVQIGGGRMLRR